MPFLATARDAVVDCATAPSFDSRRCAPLAQDERKRDRKRASPGATAADARSSAADPAAAAATDPAPAADPAAAARRR